MNKKERELLKKILNDTQCTLGCAGNRDEAMKEYDMIDSIMLKLKLYQEKKQ